MLKSKFKLLKTYCKENGLFFDPALEPVYTDVVEINLAEIEANLSGPKRPQDLIPLSQMKEEFNKSVTAPQGNQGFGLSEMRLDKEATVKFEEGDATEMKTGAIAIAAITSCTNTSNPYVLVGAGLVAKKAVELGLEVPKLCKNIFSSRIKSCNRIPS